MLSAAHTLVSIPLGLAFQNPIFVFITAAIMHVGSDMILHWNIYPHKYKTYPFFLVGIDVLGGVAIAYAFLGDQLFTLPVLAAIAGGNAPDVAHALWSFMKKSTQKSAPKWVRAWFIFHEKVQWETESPITGLIPQIIATAIAISFIFALR